MRDRAEGDAPACGASASVDAGRSATSAEPATVDRLFDGLDGAVDVIHTAGVIHPRDVAEFFAVNTEGTRNMLAAAQRARRRAGSCTCRRTARSARTRTRRPFRNDEPYHPYYGYGRSKMEAELAVFDAVGRGLDAVIVRPPWFYGPFQPPRQTTFFRMVRSGRFPVIGDGDQRRSMVYVDNLVARACVRAELVPDRAGPRLVDRRRPAVPVTEIVETVGRALRDEGFDGEAERRAAAARRSSGASPSSPTR